MNREEGGSVARVARSIAHYRSKVSQEWIYYDTDVGEHVLTDPATEKRTVDGVALGGLGKDMIPKKVFDCLSRLRAVLQPELPARFSGVETFLSRRHRTEDVLLDSREAFPQGAHYLRLLTHD